MSNIF
jgi:hypothetical protein